MNAPNRLPTIEENDWAIQNFKKNPNQSVLKLVTINGRKVVQAEERGVLTWIKAHLPTKWFGKWVGNYKLLDIHAHLKQLSDKQSISDDFKRAANKIIECWNKKNAKTGTVLEELDTPEKLDTLRKLPDYKALESMWADRCYQIRGGHALHAFDGIMPRLVDTLYRKKISPNSCPFDTIFTLHFSRNRFLIFSADGILPPSKHRDDTFKNSKKPLFILRIEPERLLDIDARSKLRERGITTISAQDLTSDDIRGFLTKTDSIVRSGGITQEQFEELMNKSTFVCYDGDNENLINLLRGP